MVTLFVDQVFIYLEVFAR